MADDNRTIQGVAPAKIPFDLEAEQSVLGGLLLDNRRWPEISGFVKPQDFFRQEHQIIFETIGKMLDRRLPTDFVTLCAAMRQLCTLEEVGGLPYIGQLANETPSAANVRAYAEVVVERAQRRAMLSALQDATMALFHGAELGPIADQIARAADATLGRAAPEAVSWAGALELAESECERAAGERAAGRMPGLPLALPALNRATGGPRPGELVGIAARTSLGKTALALQIAMTAAAQDYRGLFVVLEDNPAALALRGIANRSGSSLTKLRSGEPEAVDVVRHARADSAMGSLPLWIDSRSFALRSICARIERYQRRERIKFAVVDHLGLIEGAVRSGQKRYEVVGEITRTLKQLAEAMQIPIFLLIQVGRESEKDQRRPSLRDLRESGNIEQDLNICIAIHQPSNESSSGDTAVELGLLKNRSGPRGWLPQKFRFRGMYQRFEEITAAPEDELFGRDP